MSIGMTGRTVLNNAVVDTNTLIIELPASAPAGAAVDLFGRIQTVVDALPTSIVRPESAPTAMIISNNSITAGYLRGDAVGLAAANTGKGVIISQNGSMFLPIANHPTDTLGLENASSVYVMLMY